MDNFMRKQPVECKMEKLANYIMSYELECNRSISKSIFFKKVNKLAQKYELYRELQLFEERLLNLNVDDIVEFDDTNCWLHRNYENMLMCCILGSVELHDRIFRYTGSDTLRYILGDCTHAMCSLVTMNDTSEVDYANTYIKKSSGEYNNSDQTKEATNTFVVSFCDKEIEDDLTLWRLYGDNARGVSIEYEYEEELDLNIFQLARVSYAEKNGNHPKLDFIRELMHLEFEEFKFSLKNWVVWQHFFKPCDYRIEQEIRLLLFYDELIGVPRGKCHEWITTADGITAPILKLGLRKDINSIHFPLKIVGAKFGCNFPEKEINKSTFTVLSEVNKEMYKDFRVSFSKINNYR